jgi:hypothetical protein
MIRISVLSMMFALAVGTAGAQHLPPQPPPVASLMGQGNDQERAACHPDVSRFCQTQLPAGISEPRSINQPKLGPSSCATDQRLFDAACDESALGAAIGTR